MAGDRPIVLDVNDGERRSDKLTFISAFESFLVHWVKPWPSRNLFSSGKGGTMKMLNWKVVTQQFNNQIGVPSKILISNQYQLTDLLHQPFHTCTLEISQPTQQGDP